MAVTSLAKGPMADAHMEAGVRLRQGRMEDRGGQYRQMGNWMPVDTETQGTEGTEFRYRREYREIFRNRSGKHVRGRQQTEQSHRGTEHLREHTDTE
jgi:hypothetical protein